MTLSADNFIQSNTGSVAAATSFAPTLPSGTTAGNTVFVFFSSNMVGTPTPPAGFTASGTGTLTPGAFYKSNVSAGETSWTFTQTSADATWAVVEASNIELVEPYEGTGVTSGASKTTGQTVSSNTKASVGLSTVAFALFSASISSGSATKSWSGYTNGFVEVAQLDSTSGTNRPCLAVAANFATGAIQSYQSTATVTVSTGSVTAAGRVVVFRESGALIAAPVASATGFEFGTHGGLAETTVHASGTNQPLGGGVGPPVGTWGTHYSIGAFGRNGSYGLRLAVSAATAYVPTSFTLGNSVYGFNVRVNSGSGTPTVYTWDVTTGTDLLLVYDIATEKLGLRWGAGTVSYQSGTTPLGTWAWVEVRIRTKDTTHHAEWWVETGGSGTELQTSPGDLTGMTNTNLTKVVFGSLSSQTVNMDLDDPVHSIYYAAFPLGIHRVALLRVDTGGTATVSGTSANFNVFTSNGTLAAFNSANALAALDDVPPDVSATADGLVQVTTAASDYVELPMQNLTLAADEIIAGVRMIAAMWGGTGSGTGTLGIKGYDGVTETSLAPNTTIYDAGSPTAVSATEPLWMAAPWRAGDPWTSTQLNNAVLRVGYSSDATPDMGISAIYLEVAIRKAPLVRQVTIEDPISATADVYVNPNTSASVAYLITNNDATRSVNFNYSLAGTPQTPVTVSPSSNQTVDIHADAFGDVSDLSLEPQ